MATGMDSLRRIDRHSVIGNYALTSWANIGRSCQSGAKHDRPDNYIILIPFVINHLYSCSVQLISKPTLVNFRD